MREYVCQDCGRPAELVTCEVSDLRGIAPGGSDMFQVLVPGTTRAMCRACEARRQAGQQEAGEFMPWARRCGACAHWQAEANPVGGACCADVPSWVEDGRMTREARFCAQDDMQATGCDKYRQRHP
jgi:hypothetical protein